MNTKSLPACLALVAGFVTCVISFAQHVDTVVFAKRFIIVCLIFFIIGTVASVVINMNFKAMEEEAAPEGEDVPSDENEEGQETGDTIEEEAR